MKKQILLSVAAAGMTGLMIMSNAAGPANPTTGSGGNRTGAKGSTANCSSGGCHGTTTGVSARIWIDSAGTPVNQYTAGKTYNIKVVGEHASLTKFGFQFAAVSGSGTSQVQAGTFSGMPAQVANHSHVASGLNLVEQTSAISTISPADTFVKSFTWTAPATGVGNITLYLTVNAVDGDNNTSAGDGSTNISKTLTLYTPPSSSVGSVANTTTVSAFPNPVTGSELHLQLGNGYDNYRISVFDVTGRIISAEQVVSTLNGAATINTANWTPGVYKVAVTGENNREVISVVKQ